MEPEAHDVVVVGGGPAGLAATLELARGGAQVLLVDESDELGGQYFRLRAPELRECLGPHRPRGERLVAAVRAAPGVEVRTGTLVWGAEGVTLMTSDTRSGRLGAVAGRATLLATGAYERSVPFPGWELPGVVTPGCALRLAGVDGVAVGRRVVVAGSGPLLLVAATELLAAGVEQLRVLELGRGHRLDRDALRILAHPAQLGQLAGLVGRLARRGVRIEGGMRVVAAEGDGRVERVRIAPAAAPGPERTIAVDAAAVAYGLRPATELAQVLGLACRPDPDAPGEVLVALDAHGESSVPGVFVAGEAAGIGGAPLAEARGRAAARRILTRLGLQLPAERGLRRRRARLEAFAAFTNRRFPVPGELLAAVPDETLLCRCEGVTAGAVRLAAAPAGGDPGAIKGATRAGMGPCQGRNCGPAVAAIAAAHGAPDQRPLRPRMPIKPIPVALTSTGAPGSSP